MLEPLVWMLMGVAVAVASGVAYFNIVSPGVLDVVLRRSGRNRSRKN